MARVSIAGATGYTGIELLRLLVNHPEVEIGSLTADSHAGKNICEVAPSLKGWVDQTLVELTPDAGKECDVLFLALPHTASMKYVPELLQGGCKIVDLSVDYRLREAEDYRSWYQTPHLNPELLDQAVYGLPEIHRKEIQTAQLVANPGCYPTGAILALAPIMSQAWADPATIVIDSKSGVSGAGRKLSQGTQFCEANESVAAYGIGEHRHTPEIEQELGRLAQSEVRVTFSPHLMPMTRGLLTTAYIHSTQAMARVTLHQRFQNFYRREKFVRVLEPGGYANTAHVAGSNFCDIGVQVDTRNQRVIVTSAIDNLMKGASSQAIQNMNLMLGLDEAAGLQVPPLFP
ncbi:MAG: N-acetyl-gamma-glutamyl-phosphate reductase [Nitrospinaceae bacterium]|nr:N-acetyl-gamma-glutamyl-phosphate reductase [Nitrospinaceae bacterium]NIR54096.1 N-acetyl-gamma-glutamyl-phosphate reductase [Nitrospinaceae bacterium]NIS84514.1 N-acetyl-gamma-glutamyl-phosphate reductase [Nitrospinaceae bacterium]NIT81309.1 N-acetyl-gamma-glutamyl-phosphate reductase [Nitrospinaceae bacterium]NIU43596.1 N-acetyl-gamma-glutamyl-phosphate reductase [Nitrospinaceae bacterium]